MPCNCRKCDCSDHRLCSVVENRLKALACVFDAVAGGVVVPTTSLNGFGSVNSFVCPQATTALSNAWKYKNTILGTAMASFTIFLSIVFTNKSENSLMFTFALYLNPVLVTWLSLYILKQRCLNNEPILKKLQKLFCNFKKLASYLHYK